MKFANKIAISLRHALRDRIIKEIRDFSQKFSSSQFVITCRIAARGYTFEQFTEVEVADFADDQIEQFAKSWFKTKNLEDYGKDFIQQLEDNDQIKELATNPLLLTLLCLEFGDSRSFPIDRAQLYKRAAQTLLRKWDEKRGIKRKQLYKQLSVKPKEDLLSQLAFSTFNQNQYFFKRNIVENYIADYIINLPDAPTETKELDIDSQKVLKSIEAHHGLLVQRAKSIYSFSHLTFQEYFTAQKIVNDQQLPDLVEHITEKRWREVFLLSARMLTNADYLLKLIKKKIDLLLVEDQKIQEFLTWANTKAESVETNYQPAVVRLFYISRYLSRYLNRDLELDIPSDQKQTLQNLKTQLPQEDKDPEMIKQWFLENGESWLNQFADVVIQMIKERNIGHDWKFIEEDKQRFLKYVDANNLLLDCLENKNNYITRGVREEIESTLYLPFEMVSNQFPDV